MDDADVNTATSVTAADQYRLRLDRAARELLALADERYERDLPLDGARLSGKAEGVRLALSYLDEYVRVDGDTPESAEVRAARRDECEAIAAFLDRLAEHHEGPHAAHLSRNDRVNAANIRARAVMYDVLDGA